MTEQTLDPRTRYMRPVRISRGAMRYYEATTFPRLPLGGAARMERCLRTIGGIADIDSPDHVGLIDLCDDELSTLGEIPVNREGWRYAFRAMGEPKWENRDDWRKEAEFRTAPASSEPEEGR